MLVPQNLSSTIGLFCVNWLIPSIYPATSSQLQEFSHFQEGAQAIREVSLPRIRG